MIPATARPAPRAGGSDHARASAKPHEDRPPKVRIRSGAALFEPAILRRAVVAAFAKLDPRAMIRIPVMFVVEIGSVSSVLNPGMHGLTEITYAYAPVAQDNGSAFAGLAANTPCYDITLGIVMLIGPHADPGACRERIVG